MSHPECLLIYYYSLTYSNFMMQTTLKNLWEILKGYNEDISQLPLASHFKNAVNSFR